MKSKLAVSAVVFGLATAGLATGAQAAPSPSAGVAASQEATQGFRTSDTERYRALKPFARPLARYGMNDGNAYNIKHVLELQYRLRWAGVFRAKPTGYYGTKTRRAVRRYQRRKNIRATGVANAATWRRLIRQTVRQRGRIPRVCKRSGWHACYDRRMNQVTLFRNGRLHNSWLVRGGASNHKTRLGTNPVYYRDKDHVSSLYGSPMPHSQFFDGGQAFHGSSMMTNPFVGHSHGCINMYLKDARQLWRLTHDKRLVVTVYGPWS